MTESVPPLYEQLRAARARGRHTSQPVLRPQPPSLRRVVYDGLSTAATGLLLLFVNSFWPGLNPPERVNWIRVLARLPLSVLLTVALFVFGAALGWGARTAWWTIRHRDRSP